MSQHLDKLSIGDSMTFSGPRGLLEYKARGEFVIKQISREKTTQKRRNVKKVGMIAGKKEKKKEERPPWSKLWVQYK